MADLAAIAMAHARYLCVDIGPRPIGSPGDHAAADYAERVFLEAGLHVERQTFACPTWAHEETVLEQGHRRLAATANWFSLSCDVTGTVVPIGTLDALQHADLAGRVALLYGKLTEHEIAARASTVYYPPNHRKLNRLIDAKRPIAVLAESAFPHSIRHVMRDPDMDIPSATVLPEVGLEIRRHVDEPVRLHIAAERSMGHSCNVLGTRPGARPERIVVCAHHDTVWNCPGAIDNASGVAVMLAVTQTLAGRTLPVGLEFVSFSAEEATGLGADAYVQPYGLKHFVFRPDRHVRERSPVWEPILATINVDGVGHAHADNSMTMIAASDACREMVDRIRTSRYPGVEWVPPWPASNHYIFYPHGVPSIALSFIGDAPNVIH